MLGRQRRLLSLGVLIFIAISVAYVIYAGRGRAEAAAGAAALMPMNQMIPSGLLPGLNIATVIVLVLLRAMATGDDRRARKEASPAVTKALPLLLVSLLFAYTKSFFIELPMPYALSFDAWANFLRFKEYISTLLIFYAGFRLIRTNDDLNLLMRGAMVGFGYETVFCLLEYVIRGGRVTGHLEEANTTGAFLATYAAMSLATALAMKGHKHRWMFLGLGLAGAIGTLGTRSRGGFLALASSFLLVSFYKNRFLTVVLIVLAVTYQSWMPAPLLARLDVAYTVNDEGHIEAADTAASRIEIWKAGFRTIPDYPLGLGFGVYAFVVPVYGLEEIMHRPMKNAHNDFVLMIVELGIAGAFVFLWYLGSSLGAAFAVSRKDPDPYVRAIGSGAFGGLIGAMAASIAITMLVRMDVCGVLWIVLGAMGRRAWQLRQPVAQAKPA